jgi:hypothetical protein
MITPIENAEDLARQKEIGKAAFLFSFLTSFSFSSSVPDPDP